MIPVLQFDPASMSLWYDTHLISRCRGSTELGLAIEYAITGDDAALIDLVSCIDDEWVQTRTANVASSVWHEKRHFLDFLLTNYGALRIRHFFEMYGNLSPVVSNSVKNGRLLIPLDSNLDPVTREMMSIGDVDPVVISAAEAVARRKQILAMDRRPLETSVGLIETGGEAIMETIAYHVQVSKLQRVFGHDVSARVQMDNPGGKAVDAKYRWAYDVLQRLGLLKAMPGGDDDVVIWQEGPLLPFCYAALAMRAWGQTQTRDDISSSYLPAERFYSLTKALQREWPDYRDLSWDGAWDVVNRVSRKVFGRSVVEETLADFDLEEQMIERYHQVYNDEPFIKAYLDYHELRRRALSLLQSQPDLILDPASWADDLVNRTSPAIVVATPGGEVGLPPKGYQRLLGYRHPDLNLADTPEGQWWWAAMNLEWPAEESSGNSLYLRDLGTWAHMAELYAPLAKLLYSGHNVRAMVGPELVGARMIFQQRSGIELVLDPSFAFPQADHTVDWWYNITGVNELRCQVSNQTMQKPDGYMIDPWELRLRVGLADAMLGTTTEKLRTQFMLWRDWSPWLVSGRFKEFFDSFQADEAHLYATFHKK
jgi:hypothetical protein